MTVKDVIKVVATLIGREDVVKHLNKEEESTDTATLNTIDLMTRCVNLTVSELSATYIPMTKSIKLSGNEIVFRDIPDRMLEIVSVCDKDGNPVEYKQSPEMIIAKKSGITLTYNYLAPNYDLEGEIGYTDNKVPLRIIAYASLAEYSLTQRAFDESVMWRNRFVSELSSLLTPKNSKIKQRRWC